MHLSVAFPVATSLPTHMLGWTLVHSLWQGAALWLVLNLALAMMRGCSAHARYAACCAALGAMAMGAWLTYVVLDTQGRMEPEPKRDARQIAGAATITGTDPDTDRRLNAAPAPTATAPANAAMKRSGQGPLVMPAPAFAPLHPSDSGTMTSTSTGSSTTTMMAELQGRLQRAIQDMLPGVVACWWGGVLFFTLRLMAGWHAVRTLARAEPAAALGDFWLTRWDELLRTAGLGRAWLFARPVLRETRAVMVPLVIGWLRPLVLVPAGALAGMPPAQMEAILLHELAHIRRHDFAFNLLQSVVETLFFYHPAVWSVSARMRLERELACDDLAVAWTGNRLAYAEALALFESRRRAVLDGLDMPEPALAITGPRGPRVADGAHGADGAGAPSSRGGGDLLYRVRRILLGREPAGSKGNMQAMGAGTVLMTAVYLCSMFVAPAVASDYLQAQERAQAIADARAQEDPTGEKALGKEGRSILERRVVNRAPGGKLASSTVRVFGTLHTEDGTPLSANEAGRSNRFQYFTTGGGRAVGSILRPNTAGQGPQQPPEFWEKTIPYGDMMLLVWPKGYAPLSLTNDEIKKLLNADRDVSGPHRLVVKKGVPALVRVTAPDGSGIAGAPVDVSLRQGDIHMAVKLFTTNAEGIADLGRLHPDSKLRITIEAPGWQNATLTMETWAESGAPSVVTLKKGVVTEGVVVDAETQQTLPNARVRVASREYKVLENNEWVDSQESMPVDYPKNETAVDAQGRFRIDNLSLDIGYQFYAAAPGYATRKLALKPGAVDNRLALPKAVPLRGIIRDPQGLLKLNEAAWAQQQADTFRVLLPEGKRERSMGVAWGPKTIRQGDPVYYKLHCMVPFPTSDPGDRNLCYRDIEVKSVNGTLTFALEDITAGTVEMQLLPLFGCGTDSKNLPVPLCSAVVRLEKDKETTDYVWTLERAPELGSNIRTANVLESASDSTLIRAPARTVVIRPQSAKDLPQPTGDIRFSFLRDGRFKGQQKSVVDDQMHNLLPSSRVAGPQPLYLETSALAPVIPVTSSSGGDGGSASLPVPFPNRVKVESQLNGYWFVPFTLNLDDNAGPPMEKSVNVIPAGAIRGTVNLGPRKPSFYKRRGGAGSMPPGAATASSASAEGRKDASATAGTEHLLDAVYSGVTVTAVAVSPVPGMNIDMTAVRSRDKALSRTFGGTPWLLSKAEDSPAAIATTSTHDTYLLSPLPLGVTYVIVMRPNYIFADENPAPEPFVSEPVTLNAQHPILDIPLGPLKPGKPRQGEYTLTYRDMDGKEVADGANKGSRNGR